MKKITNPSETPTATAENLVWLKSHAAENNLTAADLMPSIRAASYDTLRRWLNNSTALPSRRAHRRALAAYRRRVEAANG